MSKIIKIGNKELYQQHAAVEGSQVVIGNETYYKISNNDAMRPFFMSIVSDSDHWMFISSTGGLTAGRTRFSLIIRTIKSLNRPISPVVKPLLE